MKYGNWNSNCNSGTWMEVKKTAPCFTCGKPDWCSYLEGGNIWICRRQGGADSITKTDKAGATYYLHGTKNGGRGR